MGRWERIGEVHEQVGRQERPQAASDRRGGGRSRVDVLRRAELAELEPRLGEQLVVQQAGARKAGREVQDLRR